MSGNADLAIRASSFKRTLGTISNLIGNVDHSKGNSPNSAKVRGQLLNDIRDIVNEQLGE